MQSHSQQEQRDEFVSFLAQQRTCIISTIETSHGVWAIPVWYRLVPRPSGERDLALDCLVPRWSDVAYHLENETEVLLIVQASSEAGLRWLQLQGASRLVEAPDWSGLLPRWVSSVLPDAIYRVVRVTPNRIDLVDEDRGWGVQETLEW